MASRIPTLLAAAGLAVLIPLSGAAEAAGSARDVRTAPAAISAMAAPASDGGTPAGGPGTVTFGIQPTPASNSDPRSAFSISATPGAAVRDSVQVDNFSDKPLTLHVYANDAINTPEGGYDLLASGQAPRDVGTWIKFDDAKPFQVIPAKSHVILPFTLAVPVNATPGDHPGGIVASYTTPSTDSHGNRVNVEQRVGSRVYLRVQGTLKASLAISKASVTYHGTLNPFGSGTATVSYVVSNTGNVRLTAKQSVHLTGMFGGSVNAPALKDLEQVLPGNSLLVTTTVTGVTPSFDVTAHISVDPAPVPGDIDPKVDPVTGSASTTAIPWGDVLLVLLLAGLGFLWFRRRRRALAPQTPAAPLKPASMSEKASARAPKAAKATAPKPVATKAAKPAVDSGSDSDEESQSAESVVSESVVSQSEESAAPAKEPVS